jgi:hypothetical protein
MGEIRKAQMDLIRGGLRCWNVKKQVLGPRFAEGSAVRAQWW